MAVKRKKTRTGCTIGCWVNEKEAKVIKAAARRAKLAVYGFVKNAALEAAERDYTPRRQKGAVK